MRSDQGSPYQDHDEVARLLPWYVNESLDEPHSGRVEAHLAVCLSCRKQLHEEQLVRNHIRDSAFDEIVVHDDFAALLARIDSAPARATANRTPGARPARTWLRRHVRALAAAAALLALVPGAVMFDFAGSGRTSAPPADYRTLARADSAVIGNGSRGLRVVFERTLAPARVDAIIAANGLRHVAGPSARGVYTLEPRRALARTELEALLVRLRAQPEVRFAESAQVAE